MVRSSRAQSRGVESQVSAAKGGGRFAKLPSFAPKYEMARRSKTLHMSMLSLTAVPSEVWNIAGLVRLDLGHNELPRLPPSVAQLSGLEQLWLNHNPLDDLPAEIELCKKLKVLDLRHTRLRRVPRELGRLKHLIEIELTDTPLGESLHLTPTSVKVEGAASGVAKEVPLYAGPLDTEQLMQHLAVKDKRDTLQAEMLEKVCAGIYREVADSAEGRQVIPKLVVAVCAEFEDLDELRNVVRNCDRLYPTELRFARNARRAAAQLREKFVELRRHNDKKRLSAELELKMRAIYYDRIEPEHVEGYIKSIYELDEPDERELELEDIQFLIKNAPRLMPEHAEEITGKRVRSAVWELQARLTEERRACVQDLFTALTTLYADREPHLVQELAEATAKLFERDRFATKREIEELKKLAADASALFPAEFRSAEPSAVRMLFKRREAEKSAALVAAS